MSRYTNGWKWSEKVADEQREDPANKAAIDRLYHEIRSLYDSIPDMTDERTRENRAIRWEIIAEDRGVEAAKQAEEAEKAKIKRVWGEIEAIEELMAARGGILKNGYEHHNEFADIVRRQEEQDDSYSDREY